MEYYDEEDIDDADANDDNKNPNQSKEPTMADDAVRTLDTATTVTNDESLKSEAKEQALVV